MYNYNSNLTPTSDNIHSFHKNEVEHSTGLQQTDAALKEIYWDCPRPWGEYSWLPDLRFCLRNILPSNPTCGTAHSLRTQESKLKGHLRRTHFKCDHSQQSQFSFMPWTGFTVLQLTHKLTDEIQDNLLFQIQAFRMFYMSLVTCNIINIVELG